jgi:hypothetical protein
VIGPAFESAAAAMLENVARMPAEQRPPLATSASPVRGGAVLRVIGRSAEAVGRSVALYLKAAWAALGDDPWSRKS